MRREFSAKVKVQAFERAGGKCEECGRKLLSGDFHYDHRVPDGLLGTPDLHNCLVLCRSCHGAKTHLVDVPAIAKAKRRQRKHIGIKKQSRFAGARTSPLKKKLNGEVVRR